MTSTIPFRLASLLLLAAAPALAAQRPSTMPQARITAALAVGGTLSSSWFSIGDKGWKPGAAPTVAVQAGFAVRPEIGIRGSAAYQQTSLKDPTDSGIGEGADFNVFTYDVEAVYRPLSHSTSRPLSAGYVVAGLGAVTANLHGFEDVPTPCAFVAVWVANGVCVPLRRTTKLALTAGLGTDIARLGNTLTAFGEYDVHGYSSPPRVYGGALNAKDHTAFTHRLLLGLRARVR
jgi:hypothetical protein